MSGGLFNNPIGNASQENKNISSSSGIFGQPSGIFGNPTGNVS